MPLGRGIEYNEVGPCHYFKNLDFDLENRRLISNAQGNVRNSGAYSAQLSYVIVRLDLTIGFRLTSYTGKVAIAKQVAFVPLLSR